MHKLARNAWLSADVGLVACVFPRTVALQLRLLQGCVLGPQLAVFDAQTVVLAGHVRLLGVELRDHRGELLTFRLFPHPGPPCLKARQ